MTVPAQQDTFTSARGVVANFPMHLWLNNTGNQRVLNEERQKYVQHVDRLFDLTEGDILSDRKARESFMNAVDADSMIKPVVHPVVAKFSRIHQVECIINESTITGIGKAVAQSVWETWRDDSPEQK